jgi:phage terminase large subunit-like protein
MRRNADCAHTYPIVATHRRASGGACRPSWPTRSRWARLLQLLADEGLPVEVFPQSSARMTRATQRFGEAVFNRALTHSGDPDLARHVGNAVVRNDSRGHRIVKEHKDSTRRIDLAVGAVMAFAAASTVDTGPQAFVFDD